MKKILVLFCLLTAFFSGQAQVSDAERVLAFQLVQKNNGSIGLQQEDLDNSIIAGTYIIPGSDIRMVYLQQGYKRIPVYNQLYVLAFRNDKLVSKAGSMIASLGINVNSVNGIPGIDPINATKTALIDINAQTTDLIVPVSITSEGRKYDFGHLGVSSENIFAELLWLPMQENTKAKLVWQVFVAPLNSSSYWLIRVDAMTNEVISKEDMTVSCNWGDHHSTDKKEADHTSYFFKRTDKNIPEYKDFVVNTATYRVVKYPAESPQHTGGTPELVTNPWLMSPGNATTLGWHNDGAVSYDSTRGNNAFAYEDRDANNLVGYSGLSTTPQPNLSFDFVPNLTLEPIIRTPSPNQQFNTVNLFYWNNLMHDLSYLYGFTETARNFQNNNMSRGGTGGDYVLAEAQDGSGTNNANFSSGVEGTKGRMQMYLWTSPTPDRDGDVDNGIIAHEYGHGISNRMTGTGSGCLSNIEQMGEGWSDFLALMITHDWSTAVPTDGFDNPRGIGTYALNQAVTGVGIRQYKYTTNMAVNPMTYANLPTVAVPHGVGTIWCTALWDMTWYIIQQAGISPDLFDPTGTGGNVVALKLVIEGLRLQPCSPGFITGRNAILKADTLFFGAQYSCAILEAFARRGMGVGAAQGSASARGDETLSFVKEPVVFTAHPATQTVCQGSNVTFTVTAAGATSYQWYLSTNGGANYNPIGGANLPSHTIMNAQTSNNGLYRCVITGLCGGTLTSNSATLTINNQPTVSAPTVTQPACPSPATGTIVVNASGSGTLEYSLNGGTYQLSNTFSGLAQGNYNITVRLQSMPSCIKTYSSNPVVINATPAGPSVSAPNLTQPNCATPSGTIVVNASGSGTLEYSLNGGPYQLSTTFSGLASGNYNITVRLQSTPACITNYSGNPVVINAAPAPNVNPVPNETLTNGSMTIAVTFTGTVPGTVYNWTNSNTSIGLAANGTGNIASFMAINNTGSVVNATVIVTPSYTDGSGTCIGSPVSFTYTVNPTPNFIRGSVKKNADPTRTDIVFKSTFTNNLGEYINYLQIAVAIPLANSAGVTATAAGVNNFQDMGSLVAIAPYTEGTEKIFGWIYFNPSPPSPVNNFNWTNGTEFTGVEISFSNSTAASVVRMVDFTNNNGGGNSNTYFAIVSNGHGDLTDYFTNLFFAIPAQSQLGNYPNGDQYVQTIGSVPPPNDDAPGSIILTVGAGCTGSPYTNVNATQSSGEPFAACKGTAGYSTVWYKFIAPASGAVKISNDFNGGTMGSDSRLALFSTTDVNNYATFTPIACDDDNGTVIADRSILYATGLTAGNTYYIQVDGKEAITLTGTFCLAVDELASSMLTTSTGCVANQSLSLINNNYTGWLSLCDGTGNLVALIKNPAGSASLSTYSSSQHINAAAVRQDAVSGQYYLNRNFNINNADVSNINIRFFFLNTELTALQVVDPVVTLSNLQVTRQTGSTCQNNFVAANGTNSRMAQTSASSGTGYSSLLITTPGLSNFYLHTSRSFIPVKTYLQGAYNAGQSRHKDVTSTWAAVLNANALVQPYSVAPYSYAGTESVTPGFFGSTAAITDPVDWVLLELRDAITPSTLITRRAALIREDGRIVDMNGTSDPSFRNLPTGNYFVVIRHRNHLDIRSSVVQILDGALGVASPALYDFSIAQSKAYQDGSITTNSAQKDFGNGSFGMYGGNGNNNSTVRASGPLAQNDYLFLITTTLGGDATIIQNNVYKSADTNMDAAVRSSGPLALNDYLFLLTTVLGGDATKIITQHQ